MKAHLKNRPDDFLDLVREMAIEWRTVELAEKQRHPTRAVRVTPRRKPSAKELVGKSAGGAVDKDST